MEDKGWSKDRAKARDAALRTLNRLTTGIAVGAIATVGGLAVVSAQTIPGTSSTAPSSTSSSSASSSSAASTQALQPSTGATASSGPAQVVTGAS